MVFIAPGAVAGGRHRLLSFGASIVFAGVVMVLGGAAVLSLAGCSSPVPPPRESPQLHIVAILYGKYLASHSGEMPANEEEFVDFIDNTQRDILERRGCKSGKELLDPGRDPERLVVLYRDHRKRLNTDWVAIGKQEIVIPDSKSSGVPQKRVHWYACDVLGAGHAIETKEADHILAERRSAEEEKASAEPKGDKTAIQRRGGVRIAHAAGPRR